MSSKTNARVLLAVAAGIGVIGAAYFARTSSNAAPAGVQTYRNLSRAHVTGAVQYDQSPPVGGAHWARWANCGVYTQTIPNELAVHSLEHGAVWITYRPDLEADQITALQETARGQSYLLVSPYPDQEAPIVLSAWGHQLTLESLDPERIESFIEAYQQGPQTPEPGAPCYGGVFPS
ncbi:hypothetical protein HNR42_001508 [Deinobacterium chartae]|uniref:DUF3105 domain-containing protein n=1 Tax=Deinobacterium chartae TaxID=521158 RepID=A0A841HYW0_9DEIO|nr:DUF3105 domain-containing protein [Deinobacterium chartae]MBB6098083.1 hypothetical protein [Deinobacterium chartae]